MKHIKAMQKRLHSGIVDNAYHPVRNRSSASMRDSMDAAPASMPRMSCSLVRVLSWAGHPFRSSCPAQEIEMSQPAPLHRMHAELLPAAYHI